MGTDSPELISAEMLKPPAPPPPPMPSQDPIGRIPGSGNIVIVINSHSTDCTFRRTVACIAATGTAGAADREVADFPRVTGTRRHTEPAGPATAAHALGENAVSVKTAGGNGAIVGDRHRTGATATATTPMAVVNEKNVPAAMLSAKPPLPPPPPGRASMPYAMAPAVEMLVE